MSKQTQQMLDEIKAVANVPAGWPERTGLEDKYQGKLPLSSGTLSYAPNMIEEVVRQTGEWVEEWEHAATLNETGSLAPDVCKEHAKHGREVIEYLKKK